MKTPYQKIGDAHREAAFLTNAEGYDVATLCRITDPGLPADHHVTDDEWQGIIDLVDAAPAMLEALQTLEARLTENDDGETLYADLLEIIRKAKPAGVEGLPDYCELEYDEDENTFELVFYSDENSYRSEIYGVGDNETPMQAAVAVCHRFGWDERNPAEPETED